MRAVYDNVFDYLSEIMSPKEIDTWFRTPQPALGGRTPIQVLETNRADGDEKVSRLAFSLAHKDRR